MPITKEDIVYKLIKNLQTNGLVRIPMAAEAYLGVAESIPFKAEYHGSEIITMGASSYLHEYLAANLIFNLKTLFLNNNNFNVLGTNLGVHIPKFEGGYYLPDALVIKREPEFIKGSTAFITNPHVILEVLSPSTTNFDLWEKLPEYKKLKSLQQIIFVSQKKLYVQCYTRSADPNIWLSRDFDSENDAIIVETLHLQVKDIYSGARFSR